ncbi:MAG: DUF2550 domain-containing protein [Rhodococcus sp. (in: high G+C Gram-positive bacteria)]|uniref:DUF2550 domain-containing protein n=1 Tax=Rhodococcus sp. TaxID=1831 RepID=UPI003BB165A3
MSLLIILVVLLAAFVAVFLYRLSVLRRGGTAAILRVTPAVGDTGWRHGVIRYGEGSLVFYKLSSLRPGPDSRIERQGIEVECRRKPVGSEFDIMSHEIVILSVKDRDKGYEIALDAGAATAFLSWVESRPSGRSVRGRRL